MEELPPQQKWLSNTTLCWLPWLRYTFIYQKIISVSSNASREGQVDKIMLTQLKNW